MTPYELTRTALIEGPHGRLQWQGTSACVDFECACGERGHLDGEFLFNVKCGACGRLYAVSPYVQLIPVPPEMTAEVESSPVLHTFGDG